MVGHIRIAAILISLLLPLAAQGEQDEITFGAEFGLMLPDFSPQAATAFTVATWAAGVAASYGVLDDLSLFAQFNFSMFSAASSGFKTTSDGLEYKGKLDFSARLFHPTLGARYKVFSGYNLAPYVEAGIGYAWTTVHKPVLLDDAGSVYDIGLTDWGEGTWTLSAGAVVDYRIANTVFAGITGRFVYALENGLLNHYSVVCLQMQYYW